MRTTCSFNFKPALKTSQQISKTLILKQRLNDELKYSAIQRRHQNSQRATQCFHNGSKECTLEQILMEEESKAKYQGRDGGDS